MTAVVTGGSRGIGRATALALAKRGVPLALLGRPSTELRETVHLSRDNGVRVEAFDCDLADPGQIAAACGRVLSEFGAPSVVVNNAAVIRRARVEQLSCKEWDEQLDVNLRAPFLVSRAFLPAMRGARTGRLLQNREHFSNVGDGLRSGVLCLEVGPRGLHEEPRTGAH